MSTDGDMTVGPRLSLDSITVKHVQLEERFRCAAKAGFAGLEVWGHEIGNDPEGPEQIQRLARQYHLDIEGVCLGESVYSWHYHWDAALEASVKGFLQRSAAIAAQFIVMPVMSNDGTLDQTATHLRRICSMAAPYGIRVGIEPIGTVPKLSDLRLALEMVSRTNGIAGVILDAFHFFRGGNRLEILHTIDSEAIVAVHLDDAMNLPISELVGYKHRVYPGRGAFDVRGFCAELFRSGYRGPYIVELCNEEYWREDAQSVCTLAYTAAYDVLVDATRRPDENR